ncbi:hypothetical protein THRCLA_20331 [Thraustotheca clavata]|uniref:Uncharacterized protein n=1 Tax=Thraustotheca clavata TaxID=74557 RepID=A0A1W0A8U8_9STRA|nr:hypothetical protein THRCLA_20331 [Thraustotheca clavata]
MSSFRDVQRQIQNEYSQALAEQVRAKEAKKRAERAERRGDDMNGGLFAGMGNNHKYGRNFARGHHVEKMVAATQQPANVEMPENVENNPQQYQNQLPQQYHNQIPQQQQYSNHQPQMYPPEQFIDFPQQQNYQNEPIIHQKHQQHYQPEPFGQQRHHQQPFQQESMIPQTNHQYQDAMNSQSFNHFHNQVSSPRHMEGIDLPHPPPMGMQNASPPPPTHPMPPGTSHGRRHMMNQGQDNNRKAQQIQAQLLLKQQMEENQRRKAEEKRKKDEEDRLEMQKIERELKAQAEQMELEKQAKAKEMRLKQQLLEQDLKSRQENANQKHAVTTVDQTSIFPNQMSSQQQIPLHQQPNQQHESLEVHQVFQSQNYNQLPPVHQNSQNYNQQPPVHQNHFQPMHMPPQPMIPQPVPQMQWPQLPMVDHHPPLFEPQYNAMPFSPHSYLQPSPSMSNLMDERLHYLTLELSRQRALVEQLVCQKQPIINAPTPTVDDLERLRMEMQQELDRRDRLHEQELERLRAEHAAMTSAIIKESSPRRKEPSVSFQQEYQPQQPSPIKRSSSFHINHKSPHSSPVKEFPGNNGAYTFRADYHDNQQPSVTKPIAVNTSLSRSNPKSEPRESWPSLSQIAQPSSPMAKPFPGRAQYNFQAASSGLSPKKAITTKPLRRTNSKNQTIKAKNSVKSPQQSANEPIFNSPKPVESPFKVVLLEEEDRELTTQSSFVAPKPTTPQFEKPVQIIECESEMIYFDGTVDNNAIELPESNTLQPRLQLSSEPPAKVEIIIPPSSEKEIDEDNQPFYVAHINDYKSRYDTHSLENQLHDSFDIDEMYHKNCERNALLKQMERITEPNQVEALVTSFRTVSTKRTAPQKEVDINGSSAWLKETPRWLNSKF